MMEIASIGVFRSRKKVQNIWAEICAAGFLFNTKINIWIFCKKQLFHFKLYGIQHESVSARITTSNITTKKLSNVFLFLLVSPWTEQKK